MSLQVWLPLNKDLRNQGLFPCVAVNCGVTYTTNGKIGGAYEFNINASSAGTKYIKLDAKSSEFLEDGQSFSLSAFFKLSGSMYSNGCGVISCVEYAKSGFSMMLTKAGKVNIQLGFGSQELEWIPNITAFSNNVWYHLCFTYEKEGRKLNLYVNGENVASTAETRDWKNHATYKISVGVGTQGGWGYTIPGYLNDVRIYSHALSTKEVKELSKGLILHYKLDDEYIEKTVNLGGTSINYSNKVYGTEYAAGSWGGDKGTITFYPSGGYNNYPYKVYHKTSGGTGGIYLKTANDIAIQSGKTYTMSIYVKSDRNYTDSTYSFNINGSSVTSSNHYITPPTSVKFTTEWQRIVHTFTATSAQTGNYGEMSIIYNDAVDDYYVYYSGFQIEENDHATPYANGTNTPVCIDCSGYRNDGIPTGAIMSNSGTPRYLASTKFSNSSCAIGIGDLSLLVPEKIFTFNIWFKKVTGEWSTKSWETILGGPSGFELEGKLSGTQNAFIHPYSWGGGSTTSGNSYSIAYDLDVWNMITMVRTTSNTKFYLNGELKVTGTAGSVPAGDYFIGAWKTATSQNYRGYFSDARIYATALSAEDIKELYNLGASIDNNGNVYSGELVEV